MKTLTLFTASVLSFGSLYVVLPLVPDVAPAPAIMPFAYVPTVEFYCGEETCHGSPTLERLAARGMRVTVVIIQSCQPRAEVATLEHN